MYLGIDYLLFYNTVILKNTLMVSDSCMKWRFRYGTDCNREIFFFFLAAAFAPNRRRCRGDCKKKRNERGTEKMSGFEFVLVVIGAATLTSWLFKAVDIVEGR